MNGLKNLFIIEHNYYEFNSAKFSPEGDKALEKVVNFIKSCVGNEKVSIFFEPSQRWIHESATVVAKSFKVIAVKSLNLNSYTKDHGNAQKMLGLINSNDNEKNVILITGNRGIIELISEYEKTQPEFKSFFKKMDRNKFHKLKSGQLYFVGIPTKTIKKEMRRIPGKKHIPLNTTMSLA